MSPQERSALEGVRVLDLSSVVMGPVCTQVLATYGADVVKVESPSGDIMRHAGAFREAGMGAMFIHANRGKRSVVIDLKKSQGIEVVRRMLPNFEVLVHNVRPEAMARLGLDYESVQQQRPDIVYAELTGYGPGGRYAGRPAFDDVIQAHSGISGLFGLQDGSEPRYLPGLIADRLTAITAAYRILPRFTGAMSRAKDAASRWPCSRPWQPSRSLTTWAGAASSRRWGVSATAACSRGFADPTAQRTGILQCWFTTTSTGAPSSSS
jgi:crotonobetainyl-CoA:carnitine CoA-transferase CaiB-like acyl-CoA transferase